MNEIKNFMNEIKNEWMKYLKLKEVSWMKYFTNKIKPIELSKLNYDTIMFEPQKWSLLIENPFVISFSNANEQFDG